MIEVAFMLYPILTCGINCHFFIGKCREISVQYMFFHTGRCVTTEGRMALFTWQIRSSGIRFRRSDELDSQSSLVSIISHPMHAHGVNC